MLIDWFTVGAQIINFLILVGLLKRFLYGPILNAIAAREKLIATQLADADAQKVAAQHERDLFEHNNEAFAQQRAALLTAATAAAQAERLRLLAAVQREANELRARRQAALVSEQQSLSTALRARVRDEVFAIARKALADLSGASLEERMAEVFVRRWHQLDDAVIARFKAALTAESQSLRIRTSFDLPAPPRAAIETALRERLGGTTAVEFETTPDLVSGIELSTNGQKVAWTIADYLAALASGVDEVLKMQAKPQSDAVSPPSPATPAPAPAPAPVSKHSVVQHAG